MRPDFAALGKFGAILDYKLLLLFIIWGVLGLFVEYGQNWKQMLSCKFVIVRMLVIMKHELKQHYTCI